MLLERCRAAGFAMRCREASRACLVIESATEVSLQPAMTRRAAQLVSIAALRDR